MIVCICNAYRTAEIEAKARETGHCDAYAVYQALGAVPRCGCIIDGRPMLRGTAMNTATNVTKPNNAANLARNMSCVRNGRAASAR